jgi:hypothetical protein
MKRALAVAFLVMSIASVALADGSGPPPPTTKKPPTINLPIFSDGSGLPPAGKKPPIVGVGL